MLFTFILNECMKLVDIQNSTISAFIFSYRDKLCLLIDLWFDVGNVLPGMSSFITVT